jgi:multisubunit Na+/H+ antiporter MnhG subunit
MTEIRKEQYKTLLVLVGGFALIAWRLHNLYLAMADALVLMTGLLSPYLLAKVTDAWMWIGEKIGAVMSRVILSFVFVFVLSPLAIIYRAFGRKKRVENQVSYFVDRNHTYSAEDLEKIF